MSNIQAITYEDVISLTQSDTTADPAGPFAAFMVNVAGNVKITTIRGSAVTITVLAGLVYTVAFSRMWSTGTTATGLFGLIAPPWKGPGPGSVGIGGRG